MALPLDQADYDRFGVDLNTSLLFDRHGRVCGCPQFWGFFTGTQNVDPSLSAQLSDYLSSVCPYSGTTSHHPHAPFPSGGATEVATRAIMSTTYTPRLHPMSTAEPHAPPSRELKETCIFWYHGNCGRGADCHFEHELNHNWPISRPPKYVHHRRCDLEFCPLRTDLVEFMQRYYPDGPRVDEIAEELEVKQEEEEHTSMTLGDEAVESDSDDTSEDESSTDSDSNLDNSEVEDDDSNHESVADDVSVCLSDTLKIDSPSIHDAPLGSSQAPSPAVPFLLQATAAVVGGSENEHPRPDLTNPQHKEEQLDAGSVVEDAEKTLGKCDRKQQDNRVERLAALESRRDAEQAVLRKAPFTPQHPNEVVSTSMRPLTPSTPGTPRISLPPASISHSGTQGRKRKEPSHENNISTKKPNKRRRQRRRMAADHDVLPKAHDLPPEPEDAPLTPPTSIRQAGTHELKRKLSSHNDDIHATVYPSKKWIKDFWVDTEKALSKQDQGLPPKPVAVPLINRITYYQPMASNTSVPGPAFPPNLSAHLAPRARAPQAPLADRITYTTTEPMMTSNTPASLSTLPADLEVPRVQMPPEEPLICFYWYHQGYCRPSPRQNGYPPVCKFQHKMVMGAKVTLPRSLRPHSADCLLPLCPLVLAKAGGTEKTLLD
ncbi:hypothetical protein P171DRAFT_483121 [Karstenula rhodostoma CBS 690.94]|uniref:C3H1-type domain-containing protein n=1 Tax=Karstenula rhodostoma CBS 690.94 TaxID=1392251 RepID=A0A9P4UEF5_9PLEO|nr:hypothetical protein P171DRAFT_483121 [Karstenula rhodostoma CBS 690.94]